MSALRDRQNIQVSAKRRGLVADVSELSSAINGDGSFDIPGVPAGSYDLRICGGGGESWCSGNLAVDVADEDVSSVVIHLPNLFEVKGTVRGSDTDSRSFAGTQIRLAEAGGAFNEGYYAVVEPSGTFRLRDVPAGTYVMNVFVRGETDYVKSILYGQRDVLGIPIEFSSGAEEVQIIVSKGAGQVEGTIQIAEQQEGRAENTSSGSIVVALVSERARRDNGGVLFARADQNSHFSFKKVPPGKYYAFAAADVESGVWENREFIARIQESGKEIEVAEGARTRIQVSVLPASDVDRAMSNLGL
jgi:hypothetical protein